MSHEAYARSILGAPWASPAFLLFGGLRVHNIRPRHLASSVMLRPEEEVLIFLELTPDVVAGGTDEHLSLFSEHIATPRLCLERFVIPFRPILTPFYASLVTLTLCRVTSPNQAFADLLALLGMCQSMEHLRLGYVLFSVELPSEDWSFGQGDWASFAQVPWLQTIEVSGLSSASLRAVPGTRTNIPSS
ncbi:hypothetical protein BOTBODRAFT_329961 [Botryobasidium botryosum FD-172 SS1]|uniref:Uncharacterized protein n=1 Tax=Botryobasidium botryosum (strain FD-172 SS1) TaxID=930990 RepID=A0A067MJD9_BOTB1|nr:hypothetical protein BOTBODRAFT_329961 [Botryobasidium botryosum FD-172 SS1]